MGYPPGDYDDWNMEEVEIEVSCKPCYGSGEDRDGADCLVCQGNGTVFEWAPTRRNRH
jgi:DnaJ-class molecular chaperone